MGRMKEFGIWLADAVHRRCMTDEQIQSAFCSRYPAPGDESGSNDWLAAQIAAVKAEPWLFQQPRRSPRKEGTEDD